MNARFYVEISVLGQVLEKKEWEYCHHSCLGFFWWMTTWDGWNVTGKKIAHYIFDKEHRVLIM